MNAVSSGFYLLWAVLVMAFLVTDNIALVPPEVTWILRPLPLLLLALWTAWHWPQYQQRRLALLVGVGLFAAADAVAWDAGHFTLTLVLSMCGFVAYITWAAQTVAMGQLRWMLSIPVLLGAMLATYRLWYVPGLIHEALVVYAVLVTVFVLAAILCSRVHWIAIPGAVLLALSQWIMGQQMFVGGIPHAAVYSMILWYGGHFLLLHAPLWHQPPRDTPFGYVLDHGD